MTATILPIVLVLLGQGRATAAKDDDGPKVEIKDVVNPGAAGFVTIQVNFGPTGMLNARAKDIIETLAPSLPIVGVEHLPRDRRFEVSAMNFAKNDKEILTKLGDKLGLSITVAEHTADFLIVRNLTHPVPPSWTPSHPPTANTPRPVGLTGIGEVDKADHLYNAYDVSVLAFFNFVTDHTDRPVWNQTCLTGTYSTSFKFPHKNVMKLLNDMGFDVFNGRRTTKCVVIEPLVEKR